jgi:hypothetical protein
VPKTVESILGLPNLTDRDAQANDLSELLTLSVARTDAPTKLPDPPDVVLAKSFVQAPSPSDLIAENGNLFGFLGIFLKENLELSPAYEHEEIKAQCEQVKTRQQYEAFVAETMKKVDHYQMMNPPTTR